MGERADSVAGVLLGTAIGDALGLPREGLGRRRARRLFGEPPLRHSFVLGRGMVSDDTEHTCLVGQALLRAPHDPERFARALAWGLRLWLLGVPAGVGWATLRATVRLWLGVPPSRSGVFSAGNGPAMRAALLGVCLGDDPERLRAYVRTSTRLTHTDPRAERGALLVALAAHHDARQGPGGVSGPAFLATVRGGLVDGDAELDGLLAKVEDYLARGAPAEELAEALGLRWGVGGYIYHTVPLALYCWLHAPGDFRGAVEEVLALGGDTDTTGAIVGALAGATVGAGGIPAEWVEGLLEWPRSVAWLRALAARLAEQFPGPGVAARPPAGGRPLPLLWPGLVPRNVLFAAVVLLHALRRTLPPY
jgi:ADP-ribosyl-[dinitrogen reductase] hydrolase